MSKAKAEITIYHIVDISKVTRYYKLQSSTASTPSAPTTNPPSGWTTTEPTYTSGSTNTLYFVDLTEFTNGTFKYSAVSKSSSYEAAKAAYNKAVSTENFVTNHMELTDAGLVVGNLTEETLKGNVLIDTDSVDIRIGEKAVASYQGDTIYLGLDKRNSLIDLCDGTGLISSNLFSLPWLDSAYTQLSIASETAIGILTSDRMFLNVDLTEDTFDDDTKNFSSHSAHGTLFLTTKDPIADAPLENTEVFLEGFYRQDDVDSESGNISEFTSGVYIKPYIDGLTIKHESSRMDHFKTSSIVLNGGITEDSSCIVATADDISLNGNVKFSKASETRKNLGVWMCDTTTNSSYYGIAKPNGDTNHYVRASQKGFLPYSQAETGMTSAPANYGCNVGTQTWPFDYGYIKNGYFNNIEVSGVLINSSSNIVMPNNKGLYSKKTDGTTTRNLLFMNTANECILGYGGWTNDEGSTRIYGKTVKVYSKELNTNFYLDATKPYYEAGDSISTIWWATGFVSNSKKSVYFTIPLAKPVVGDPTITITYNSEKIKVRQNGNFAYGSSSGVTPSSYSAKLNSDGNAIKVTLNMPNTTNATDNDVCAISADIKITFS